MAYRNCPWCYGQGCLFCEAEEEKAIKHSFEHPLMIAHRDNPEEMEALKRVFGRESMDQAFGPGGNGMLDIHIKLLNEAMRKQERQSMASANTGSALEDD